MSARWSVEEEDILQELAVDRHHNAHALLKELSDVTQIPRTKGAVFSKLREFVHKGVQVNPVLFRQMEQLTAADPKTPKTSYAEYVSVEEAAELTGKSTSYIRKKANLGLIGKRENLDGKDEFLREDLEVVADMTPEPTSEVEKYLLEFNGNIKSAGITKRALSVPLPVGRKQNEPPFMVEEEIGPARAKQLLDSSIGNRTLRKNLVERYVGTMRAGEWHLVGDSIDINKEGHITNAHHRMLAVLISKTTQRFWVQYNVPKAANQVRDMGGVRKAHDNVKHAFALQYSKWARAGRLVFSRDTTPISTADLELFMQTHVEALDFGMEYYGKRNRFSSKVYVSSAFVLTYYVNPQKVKEFTDRFVSGLHLTEGSPVTTALRLLDNQKGKKEPRDTILKLMRCILAFIDGESLSYQHVYAKETTAHRVRESLPKGSLFLQPRRG